MPATTYSTKDINILFGTLSNEASVLGAGSIALEQYFEIPTLKTPRFMIESLSQLSLPGRQIGNPREGLTLSHRSLFRSIPVKPNRKFPRTGMRLRADPASKPVPVLVAFEGTRRHLLTTAAQNARHSKTRSVSKPVVAGGCTQN